MWEVLKRLRRASLYIKFFKCVFYIKSVNFLDYWIRVNSVLINSSRVKTIREWLISHLFQDIQILLKFTNFYKQFIYKYSSIVTLITNLLKGMIREKKTGPYNWPTSADQVLSKLNSCFKSASVLQHYNLEKSTQIKTDVSKFVIGEVLSQLSKEHVNSVAIRWEIRQNLPQGSNMHLVPRAL